MRSVSEASASSIFTIFFTLIMTGFMWNSREARGAGLTPETILQGLGLISDEENNFIQYHIKRTSYALILNSLLPFTYMFMNAYITTYVDGKYDSMTDFYQASETYHTAQNYAFLLIVLAVSYVWYLSYDNNKNHNFTVELAHYARGNIDALIDNINQEFRSIDKVCIECNSIDHLIITDNWIMRVGTMPLSFRICHQTDANIKVQGEDRHDLSPEGEAGGVQYLNVLIENKKRGPLSWGFRLNSLDYENFKSKIQVRIQVNPTVKICKGVMDRFKDVFKAEVEKNARVTINDELENCIACMVNTANVQIIRVCGTSDREGGCVNCYCRPLFCIDCMAIWFANRQSEKSADTWLAQQCPCPTCRSKFCVLDVSLVEQNPTS